MRVPVEVCGHADDIKDDAPTNGNNGFTSPQPKHNQLIQNVRNGTLPLVAFLAGEDEDVGLNAMEVKVFFNVV